MVAPTTGNRPLTSTERSRLFRARASESRGSNDNSNNQRNVSSRDNWESATLYFAKNFIDNQFGFSCDVCDRLWFHGDLKCVDSDERSRQQIILRANFDCDTLTFKACATCHKSLAQGSLPQLSKSNGFFYPPKPDLPPLDEISARLIAPRLPFMAIRRLRWDTCARSIIGQVINVPVDVDTMVRSLPRQLDNDLAINVVIKKKLVHTSKYLQGHVKKGVIEEWLRYLIKQPLYQKEGITIDWSIFDQSSLDEAVNPEDIEDLSTEEPDINHLMARQQTILWNEEHYLEIAPGQNKTPLNLIYDDYAEELSFPDIYYGCPRIFNVRVTPHMMAMSEVRRRDRRGARPTKLLYSAMKVMRYRVVEGMYNTFKNVSSLESFTKKDIESNEFLDDLVNRNLSFLKSIPNSSYYWASKKKDLFAMIRQHGKPTFFLTMSANEINWPHLLKTLIKLSGKSEEIAVSDPLRELDKSRRCALVNEDPVVCCAYFHKLVEVIMRMLGAKTRYNPFGKFRVQDFFLRIEFQHRGSPHAHILLWLEGDPEEPFSRDMPLTIDMMRDLVSVSRKDVPSHIYDNHIHRHTQTCYKRGEKACRFNIPFWPMRNTIPLIPMAKDDARLAGYRARAKQLRDRLEHTNYESIDAFFTENNLDEKVYISIIESSLNRPTIMLKRDITEIRTNPFNPWISKTLNSNTDLQFVADSFGLSSYIAEYINKCDRGFSNLHKELTKIAADNPELTYDRLMKKIGAKVINSVEMTSQEAAWYLLKNPMSHFSREVVYIPTLLPCERQRSIKHKSKLSKLDPDSRDIWSKSLIDKYQERPAELEDCCLADFSAWYTTERDYDAFSLDQEQHEVGSYDAIVSPQKLRKRKLRRTIRYRNYDISDSINYKREMVLLFIPFRDESVDVLDRKKFISIFEENKDRIAKKRAEYVKLDSIEQMMEIYRSLGSPDDERNNPMNDREIFVRDLADGNENFDDFDRNDPRNTLTAVKRRTNVMEKQDYCAMMRLTNRRQRELILECLHRIHSAETRPLQVFFTGPAGSGKTFVLKLIMESFNRYAQVQNSINNSFVACASTGRAAASLGGTTVHSAFHIALSKRDDSIGRETLQTFRLLFSDIWIVIIDEISMVSSAVFYLINQRLQQITSKYDQPFGGMFIIFCGDFKQLPPVRASPIYKGSRDHLQAAYLWQGLDYFPLDEIMRQSDIMFSSILTKIGEGLSLNHDDVELIQSRFRTKIWCDEHLVGVIRLFHRNKDVQDYNDSIVQEGREYVSKNILSGYRNDDELKAVRGQLHRKQYTETGGLPYIIKLAVGYPYIITTNIDVADKLVNGTIGTLKYIEDLAGNSIESDESNDQKVRVWLEFADELVGAAARAKSRHIYTTRREIYHRWVPFVSRSTNFDVTRTVRCRREQLPLVPALALTIHKSQGGTFDRIVIGYDKSMSTQLIYVAMSRVTSIEGLFFMNANNDFTFQHHRGCDQQTTREIRSEYARLNNHRLNTITTRIENFLLRTDDFLCMCLINSQSLVAHEQDISSDHVIVASADILSITETWMENSNPIIIQNYELVACNNISAPAQGETTRRSAGGAAIYRKVSSKFTLEHLMSEDLNTCDKVIGDHVTARIDNCEHPERASMLIHVFYLHPNIPKHRIESYLLFKLRDIKEELSPIIVTGDFNLNIEKDRWIVEFMKNQFQLNYVEVGGPTTLLNTTIDLTFIRDLNVEIRPYVSYFSQHRPLLHKIKYSA